MKLLHTFRWYGAFGFIRLILQYILSKIIFRNVRIIRYPFYIRSVRPVKFGKQFTAGVGFRLDIEHSGEVKFGKNIQVNDYVHIASIKSIEIGDGCLIASRVFISDHNHGTFDSNSLLDSPVVPPALRPLSAKPICIGSNVWIGESVCVLPGVTIGDGAVIGAGSVVTRDVPPGCVSVGNPARLVRCYDPTTQRWKRVDA